MQFTYDETTKILKIEDKEGIHSFILEDGYSIRSLFLYVIKAIDELDNQTIEGKVPEWVTDESSPIPESKLNVGTGPGQLVKLDENGKIPSQTITLEEVLKEDDHLTIIGGDAQ